MFRYSLLMVALTTLAACDVGSGGRVDGRDGDISDSDMFESVEISCDGDASIWDYLVVMEAYTTDDVSDVSVELFQRGDSFGVFELDEVRPGEWYADAWEDDLWIECEDSMSATFTGIDDSGNVEFIDL